MTEPARELLTAGQVAAAFMVSLKTVTRWVRAGRLSCTFTKGGHRRFDPGEVEALLRECGYLREEAPRG